MIRSVLSIVLVIASAVPALPCGCGPPRPACEYLSADAIFLGRVSFTNDDGSGSFVQATLVRFDVEEIFKGIPKGTKQVWVDPGSFTSCYEEYKLGVRYLIVARRAGLADSAAMTVWGSKHGVKPLPPGIDPAKPPIIYSAPECDGSRPADGFPNIEQDYAMLRAYREGKPVPRIFGYAYLDPFSGWPFLNGPQVAGARVSISNAGGVFHTTTGADGSFAIYKAPPGKYSLSVQNAPLVPVHADVRLEVPPVGCATEDFPLRSTAALTGIVLERSGRAAAKVPVQVEIVRTLKDLYPTSIDTETDASGHFSIRGIPDMDARIAYGSSHPSSDGQANPKVVGESVRLRPGEQLTGLVLWLPAPPKVRRVAIKVLNEDGRPANRAFVGAVLNGRETESSKTDSSGKATLPCLEGFSYELEAHIFAKGDDSPFARIRNQPVQFECRNYTKPIEVRLNRRTRH